MATDSPYRKVPGIGSGLASRSRLYLGDDHLLHVESFGYTERYHRFYYRDIHAISMRRTRVYQSTGLLLGIISIILALVASTFHDPDYIGLVIVSAVFLSISLVLLVVHLALGPTCVCEVHTAANHMRLRSLSRIHRAKNALNLIRPRIEAAQGVMDPDQMSAEFAEYDARILQGRAL